MAPSSHRCSGTLARCFCSRASSISAWEAMRDGPPEESVGYAPSAIRPDQDEKTTPRVDLARGFKKRLAISPASREIWRHLPGNPRGQSALARRTARARYRAIRAHVQSLVVAE